MQARWGLHGGWLSGVVFAVVVSLWDTTVLPGGPHMLSVYGSTSVPAALWWNVFGFIVPGLLVGCFALALEGPMRAGGAMRGGRIGSTLLLLSGVFFAAQGLLPYDLAAPDEHASQWHVTMLSLSFLAFLPATALIAASLRHAHAWQVLRVGGSLLAAAVLAGLVLPPEHMLPALQGKPALLQRVMLALYFGWMALAAFCALRSGVSRDARRA